MTKTCISVILPLKLGWEPCYYLNEDDAPVRVGSRVKVLFAGRKYAAVVSAVGIEPQTDESRIRSIISVETGLAPVSGCELELWREVAGYYLCTVGEVYKACYQAIRLDNRKLPSGKQVPASAAAAELSDAQRTAFDEIKRHFAAGKVTLLNGVTGSGKTEIYIKLASEALSAGKNVLYLVPEIAVGRQLTERLSAVFGDRLLIYNSSETIARRRKVATAVRDPERGPYIVLGTRSAIFLPHRGLSLVIVDEEHDTSYKQDAPAPRYHARETAVMLGKIHGSDILLGSATPSLEALYNCRSGRFALVTLNERFYNAADAETEIIDTVAEKRKRGMKGSFSRKLIERIAETLGNGGQVLILRARRSYSPAVQCPDCGYMPRCPHCNVTLSLHRTSSGAEKLICHYCGHAVSFDTVCPECGGRMQSLGAGTQRIEEELHELFPNAVVDRLDGDTARGDETEIIRRFSSGETDILVGTQIISKGFDFSGLSLVAVLQADSIIGLQDFRADERALQLFAQFRGRSGRRGDRGRLVIQTARPEHPVLRQLLHGNENDFTDSLLAERRMFGYPPFTRLVNIVFRDGNLQRLELLSADFAAALSSALAADAVSVTGPAAPLVDRISEEYIRHVRVALRRDRKLAACKKLIAGTVASFEKERNYSGHIVIDVDPV